MPVEYVDPNAERSRLYRASEQFARTRIGRRWGMHVAPHIDPYLYRITKGRYPVVMGMVLNAPLGRQGGIRRNRRNCQRTRRDKGGVARGHMARRSNGGSSRRICHSFPGRP